VLFPPDPAGIPGWVMWLARRDGAPMGCCATFDDGSSVGLYGMAVDPGMRRQGAGRALIDAMVARYPGMPSCLTATEEGFWLYASAGYRTAGLAAWWRGRPGSAAPATKTGPGGPEPR
jgi:GNAT superfamily N-acetyltransferase